MLFAHDDAWEHNWVIFHCSLFHLPMTSGAVMTWQLGYFLLEGTLPARPFARHASFRTSQRLTLSAWGIPSDGRSGGGRIDRDAVQSTCTNHRNRGRTSADRSTRATLMLTVPRSINKSSTKDLT